MAWQRELAELQEPVSPQKDDDKVKLGRQESGSRRATDSESPSKPAAEKAAAEAAKKAAEAVDDEMIREVVSALLDGLARAEAKQRGRIHAAGDWTETWERVGWG